MILLLARRTCEDWSGQYPALQRNYRNRLKYEALLARSVLARKALPCSPLLRCCHPGGTSLRPGLYQTDLSHVCTDRRAGDLRIICRHGGCGSEQNQREQGSFHSRRSLRGTCRGAFALHTTATSSVWFPIFLNGIKKTMRTRIWRVASIWRQSARYLPPACRPAGLHSQTPDRLPDWPDRSAGRSRRLGRTGPSARLSEEIPPVVVGLDHKLFARVDDKLEVCTEFGDRRFFPGDRFAN